MAMVSEMLVIIAELLGNSHLNLSQINSNVVYPKRLISTFTSVKKYSCSHMFKIFSAIRTKKMLIRMAMEMRVRML